MAQNQPQSTGTLGSSKREEPSLMNLPPSLSQQTPICRTPFYVDEASLYSIAEDSREDRQSEITSRAGTVSTASTPVSIKVDPPFSLRSSPLSSEWDFDDDDDWGGGRNGNSFENTLVDAAKVSRWIPPTEPSLDAEEMSNNQSEDGTYPMSVGHPLPIKPRICSRNTILYALLIALLLASIATIACIPLLRKTTASERSSVTSVVSGNNASPTSAPTTKPTTAAPTALTFPTQINSEDERHVYAVLASCSFNDLSDLLDAGTTQYQVFNQLVIETKKYPNMSTEELLERWALVLLFLSTDGEYWDDTQYWFIPGVLDVCAWGDGTISCDTRVDGKAAVTGLHLRNNGLRGKIPKELCCLKELQKLDLSANALFGTVPQCLKDMQLSYFDMTENPGLS
ncbi:hypothetical protein ACA910_021702 [Epithemia clementina (nom. ined.)]